ncbi:hypothetical protein [Streptosporangium canum]|uniref:hypothetical protein n=1 Tax=Streptosporangium canum TaxID=324952 RepID=UPI0037B95CAB
MRIARRLYLTEDKSRVVEEGDLEAATLLCSAGGEVSHATAQRYGLLEKTEPTPKPAAQERASGAEKPDPAPKDEKAEPEKKAPAPANKARGRTADK